jgi:hypothetical protein
MSMANPCPCELVINESLLTNPPTSITDSTINDIVEDKLLEDYLEHLSNGAQSELNPLFRQTKSLDITQQRYKRPSWAAVGKRAASLEKRLPSWAQVG